MELPIWPAAVHPAYFSCPVRPHPGAGLKAHSASSTSPVCSLQRRRSHQASPGGCTSARLKTTAVPVHWSSARKETQLTTVFLDSWSLAGASAIDRCYHTRLPSLHKPTGPRHGWPMFLLPPWGPSLGRCSTLASIKPIPNAISTHWQTPCL